MANGDPDLRPICFMVMPFRKRAVGEPRKANAPAEVDCDALWDKAFRPAIEEMGYLPIRADFDPGSLIVKDMLERLAYSELVLADVSLANANVYYEVGLRHVAFKTHCVLLAASWSVRCRRCGGISVPAMIVPWERGRTSAGTSVVMMSLLRRTPISPVRVLTASAVVARHPMM